MGTWYRDRDEDLTLFHDMRARERNNFLYPSNDDIEASLSTKFGGLSGYRVGGCTPTRKGTGDLLVLDAEKSDYNWLLTPPGTPLFPSLDQDVPIIHLSQREALNRSTSASKTSRLSYPQEPSSKLHRGNLSPRRPGTANSTSSTTSTNRGRSSSPSITSSSPILRPSSPSCRPTTPGRRTSVNSRSGTPDLRRLNTSPVIRSPSVSKPGSSSGKTRGKSLSPKLRPWEPSMPGFSSEPPPNLRTSLSDCSTQRGGSQRSRHGGTAATRNSYLERSESSRPRGRSTTSPDPFRSCSLSSTQEYTSSQTSRGSVISSFDDDTEMTESVASASTKTSSEAASRNGNPSISARSILPAKRQTRPAVSEDKLSLLNVGPKRASERQVDRHRSSQSMFRPLLSSIPATSFYSSRAADVHHRSTSSVLESSVTMSSDRTTEQGVKIFPGSTMNHDGEGKKDSTRGGPCLEKSGDFIGNDDEHMNPDGAPCAHARNHYSSLSIEDMKESEGEIGTSIADLKDRVQSSTKTEEANETINACVFVDKLENYTRASVELKFSVNLGDPAHISESKVLEANEVQRMPNKSLLIESSAICMGRDSSKERKEVLHGDTFTDVGDGTEINSSLQSSGASVCDFQSTAVYQRSASIEDIAEEDHAEHASEQCSELVVLDALLEKTLSCYSDGLGKEDILFMDTEMMSEEQFVLELDNANPDTTAQDTVDLDTRCKLPSKEDVEADELFENSTHDEAVVEDTKCPDGALKKQQPGATLLKRNVTLEEATDTILFCNSIVHGIVYKAATIAMQREDDALARKSDPKREHIALFGRLEAGHRNTAGKDALQAGNWKQPPADSAIQRTFRYVQKRRMVHQQTPTVILHQSPMDRTENAIVGNREEDLTQTMVKEHQKKTTAIKTVDSKCSCSIM